MSSDEKKVEKPQKQQQKKKDSASSGAKKVDVKLAPKVEDPYYEKRLQAWNVCAQKRAAEQAAIDTSKMFKVKIGGTQKEVVAGSTYLDVAKQAEQLKHACAAKVNGTLVDLPKKISGDCEVEIVKFDSPEGAHVFWHSSAHILGYAIEMMYPKARLCVGPPLDDAKGFYYDFAAGDRVVSSNDFDTLNAWVQQVIAGKHRFERLELTKPEALDLFADNPFKVELINDKVADGERCSAYRCGDFIDLCLGPHVPNTGFVKAMTVTKVSSCYWKGDATKAPLQRVYGVSFPEEKQLKEYLYLLDEADKRDHRKIGAAQELFFFHELSPGSAFFLPHGAHIYNTLVSFIRDEYSRRGYQEVVSPNMYNVDLWKTSGHYQNYRENMFSFKVEEKEFALKPMNCPGHCLMYKHALHSFRDLPWRCADFGVLHRNEFSGALTGLTRVRRFQQDDAHIFARPDQIEQEVSSVLAFIQHVYRIFGFEFTLMLSTRPDKYLGEIAQWDEAERQLKVCLDKFGKPWTLNPGDGAFYGPKIDIQLFDALKRKHQCATVQLDFQLPIRFDLTYKNTDGQLVRPVMIHRAILGSVERMIAVLCEHTGGDWPFWLAPRQVMVATVSEKHKAYAQKVYESLKYSGLMAELDDGPDTVGKKIAVASTSHFNYIIVVGDEEVKNNSVAINDRLTKVVVKMSLDDALKFFHEQSAKSKTPAK